MRTELPCDIIFFFNTFYYFMYKKMVVCVFLLVAYQISMYMCKFGGGRGKVMALYVITTIDLLPLPTAIRLLRLGIVFIIGKKQSKIESNKKKQFTHVAEASLVFFWRIIICIKKNTLQRRLYRSTSATPG